MGKNKNEELCEAFGKVLRLRRNALGLSQEEFAHRADVSMRFISLLETGKRQPTLTTLYSLSRALEISFTNFAGEIEKELGLS